MALVSGLPAELNDLGAPDLRTLQEAVRILLRAGLRELRDLAAVQAALAARAEREARPAVEERPQPVRILPDLLQVHQTLSAIADSFRPLPDPLSDATAFLDGKPSQRKWMFYLMPVWNPSTNVPQAQQFWQCAHMVARDQNFDDWIAPHITLHSRASDLAGLAALFARCLREVGGPNWGALLRTLRDPGSWSLDADTSPVMRKPSNEDQYVLHKAKIDFPQALRAWLTENQDPGMMPPRKQDVAAHKRRVQECEEVGDRVEVTEPFHISLYSFRATHRATPLWTMIRKVSEDETACPSAAQSTEPVRRRMGRKMTEYELACPREEALVQDLCRADWMLVLASPGSTSDPPVAPEVLAAARLTSLVEGLPFA